MIVLSVLLGLAFWAYTIYSFANYDKDGFSVLDIIFMVCGLPVTLLIIVILGIIIFVNWIATLAKNIPNIVTFDYRKIEKR